MGRANVVVLGVVGCLLASGLALGQTSFQDEIANLRSPNVGTREKAAKSLGKSGRPEAIPALTEAMRDPEIKVRKATLGALRSFNSTETVDGLLIGFRDEDKNVRETAMVAMLEIYVGAGNAELGGSLGFLIGLKQRAPSLDGLIPVEERVVTAFELRLQDEEPGHRRRSAYSLGVLGAPDAVDSLKAALADPNKDVRLASIEALGKIATEPAGEALVGALRDPKGELVGAVVDALGEMRYLPAASELVSVYDANLNKMGDRALVALAKMGAPEARGIFYYQMTSDHSERRRWAVEGLGRLNDEALVSGLMKDFLREPDPAVQLAYCFSIAKLGRPEFVDRIALGLADNKLIEQARAYAVELGSPLLSELVTYLSDPVPQVRKEMAQVLMEIGDPAAIPYLKPLLSDPDGEVADRANRAIARLQQGRMSASSTP